MASDWANIYFLGTWLETVEYNFKKFAKLKDVVFI